LDNERRWYRHHHLFADVLRGRLQRKHSNRVPTLHRRASEWYEHNGRMLAAIEHALAAQDLKRAALLIEPAAWPAIHHGEYSTLRRWLETLPEDLLFFRPQLCLMYAWGLIFAGEIEAYERPLAAGWQIWQEEGNEAKLGQVLNLRADMALSRNQLDTGIALAQQALELLDEGDSHNRSLSWMCLGSAFFPMGEFAQERRELGCRTRSASNVSGEHILSVR
jgi:LuxR family maltose regulon positive regulatory protein